MASAQKDILKSVGNHVVQASRAGINAMPWPETYTPTSKGANAKTVHVTENVSWMTKQKN